MIPDPLDDVADSTDWLSTPLSGLAAVEAALRCQVCKDFYKTPMLTSCNHTFCSVCIRRALSNDGKCPLCRASEQELKLRSNWSMEETVEAFVKTRRHILDFAKRPTPTSAADSPKRKLDHVDREDEVSGSQRSNKRLRSSARLSKSRGADATAEMARQGADVQDTYSDMESYEPVGDGLVACPVCLQRMKENQVFHHLDTSCPGEPQAKPPTRQSSRNSYKTFPSKMNPPPPNNLERLPAINYSMLKEPQLRKKLQEFGISTAGNRQMLEKRHKEWMTIWNANCDSLHPRRKEDLLNDLEVWERTLGTRAPTSSRSIHLGAQIKDKDFDGAAWAAKHGTSFKDLIANARKNRPKKQEQTTGPDKGASGKTAEGERPPEIPPAAGMETPNSPTANHPDRVIVDLTDGPGSHIVQEPNRVVDTSSLGTPTEIPRLDEMAQQ
ncbi:hypothetical protein DL767_003118 [Monosporascus sp. MG133]|nr:hypothetical protein DL767_003118 [Monosporascus sp. MG133]